MSNSSSDSCVHACGGVCACGGVWAWVCVCVFFVGVLRESASHSGLFKNADLSGVSEKQLPH